MIMRIRSTAFTLGTLAFGLLAMAASACGDDSDSGSSQSSSGPGSSSSGSGTSASSSGGGGNGGGSSNSCPGNPSIPVTSAVISDFEGAAGSLEVKATIPSSNWTRDTDGTGTTDFKAEVNPAGGYALHFTGQGTTIWGADVAATFAGATKPIDASQYQGIRFKIMGTASDAVVLKVQNPDAIPESSCCDPADPGGTTACYAGYVTTVAVTPAFSTVQVTWAELGKAGWGYHSQDSVDSARLVSLAIATSSTWDLWIDDVEFFQ